MEHRSFLRASGEKCCIAAFFLLFTGLLPACAPLHVRLDRRCVQGEDGESCYKLSRMYAKGKDGEGDKDAVEQDAGKALEYLKKGCDRDHEKSCRTLAQIKKAIGKPETPRPTGITVKEAVGRCEEGHVPSCDAVVEHAGPRCKEGDGESCSHFMAVLRRKCDTLDQASCSSVFQIAKAMCDAKVACGCGEMGRLMVSPHPPVRLNRREGIRLLKIGCADNCDQTCKLLQDLGQG